MPTKTCVQEKKQRMDIMISNSKSEENSFTPTSSAESLIEPYSSSENIPSYFDSDSECEVEDFPSSDDSGDMWEP